MKLLDQYISKAVAINISMALLILGGMDTLFAFIAELEDTHETYGIIEVGFYICLTFPRRCYEFIPVATLIGSLLAMGGLASSNELTVMRAAGASLWRIISATFISVLGFASLALMLSQWIVPTTEQSASSYRAIKQGYDSLLKVKQGSWHREGQDIIHFNALEQQGVLHGITRLKFDDQLRLLTISFAQKGTYQSVSDQAPQWLIEGTRASNISKEKIQTLQESHTTWQTDLTPEIAEFVITEPDLLSISKLYYYSQHLAQQGLDHTLYLLAFWEKILQPVATVVMILLATSFIFGPLRSVTVGLRILIGLILGMFFHYLQDFLSHSSIVFGMPPILAISLPIISFTLLAAYALKRAH